MNPALNPAETEITPKKQAVMLFKDNEEYKVEDFSARVILLLNISLRLSGSCSTVYIRGHVP